MTLEWGFSCRVFVWTYFGGDFAIGSYGRLIVKMAPILHLPPICLSQCDSRVLESGPGL